MKSMLNMASRSNSIEDDEVSSAGSTGSNSSGVSRFGGPVKLVGGGHLQPPSSPQWGHQIIVPQYTRNNRMLMRSPLPSPTGVVRKKIVQPQVGSSETDSDSDDGSQRQRKREEANISRLVTMAKAQQHLMTAWFAASAGAESVSLPVPLPRPKRARRQTSSGSAVSVTSRGSGPVDLDSGAPWDEYSDSKSVGSQSSTGSSKTKAFLRGMLGSNSPVPNEEHLSVMTGETPRISNMKPRKDDNDIEVASITDSSSAEDGGYVLIAGRCKCTRNQIVFAALVVVFCIVLISVSASLAASKSDTSPQLDRSQGGNDYTTTPPRPSSTSSSRPTNNPSAVRPSQTPSLSASPSTPLPSFRPTASPSMLPSVVPTLLPTLLPSVEPSLHPTLAPSTMPSYTPTATPSLLPSSTPTMTPSKLPTFSRGPSLPPSSSPTTIFSTTEFLPVGGAVLGQQQSEQFGYATSLNGDGSILAVGARYYGVPGAERIGRVEVLERRDNLWVSMGQSLYGRNSHDQFGFSVALSDDGRVLAVSEPGFDGPVGYRSGNVRIFALDESSRQWAQLGQDILGEEIASLFGVSISLAADGRRVAIGSPYHDGEANLSLSGRVRVFAFQDENSSWVALGQPLDGTRRLDWFGWSVELSADGRRVVVGAPRNRDYGGYVRCFDFDGTNRWNQVGEDIVNDLLRVHLEDRFGLDVSLDGDRIAVGSPWKDSQSGMLNSGMVTVYQLDGGWNLMGAPIEGDSQHSQTGMSLQLRGDYLTVGSPGFNNGAGKVSFHRYDGASWDTTSTPLVGVLPKGDFGLNLATDRDSRTTAVGSPVTTISEGQTGSVKVFIR